MDTVRATPRRWAINGRFVGQAMTGVQRYAREIVCAMDRRLGSQPHLLDALRLELLLPPGTRLPFELEHIAVRSVGRHTGHAWEQLDLPRAARDGLLSLANTGPVAHRDHIVCLHDTNTRTCKQSYSRAFRTLYRILHPALGLAAKRIATVSAFSAGDIVRYGIAPRSKLFVAPNGSEHARDWQPDHVPATLAAAGPDTIVVLGSAAPHKNVQLLLDLAPALAEKGLRLAIAGQANSKVFATQNRAPTAATRDTDDHTTANIHWLGRIPDAAFAALLDDCLCLAFPSLTEGFGLPPLEAMARGCPVVVSDRASLPEICGPAALYARPDAPAVWLDHFVRLRNDAALRKHLVAAGLAQSRTFSWPRSADIYLNEMMQ